MNRPISRKLTPSQKTFSEKEKVKKEFRRRIDAVIFAEEEKLKQSNPDYADLGVKPMNIIYVKGRKGITKAYLRIAKVMITPRGVSEKTQKEILEAVQAEYPNLKLNPNIWNRKLHPGIKKTIEKHIQGNTVSRVSIKDCNTLAEIKKKIKISTQAKGKSETFKTEITFTEESVIIGKNSYALVMRGTGERTYPSIRVDIPGKGRCWVRADALLAVLKKK